jgi:hypothetical protein
MVMARAGFGLLGLFAECVLKTECGCMTSRWYG